ncbi:MAG: cupin domain-containing protein [Candidatus Humimicrobiaceae bacterium]
MLEKIYKFNSSNKKLIEKIVSDENVNINHMVLPQGERLPIHNSNSNVYLIITEGEMSIALQEEKPALYAAGTIVNVPFDLKMDIQNKSPDTLEFFVVKAPHPRDMKK